MAIEIPDGLKYELIERWRKSRRFINKNPRAVWGISLASGFILFLVLLSILSGPSRPKVQESDKAWFYDLNTSKLFVGKANQKGPIKAPSGPLPDGRPAGIRAHVFTYVDEPNENDLVIGYLEMPDPDFAQKTDQLEDMIAKRSDWGLGKLLRRVDDTEWVQANSSLGKLIMSQATKRDDHGRIPRYYTPK
jgi:hypothetical protein